MPDMDFFADFLDIASELADDDGRALAENIGQNLGLAVRPARNKLEEVAYSRKRRAQILADADMELSPQRENALRMSFDTHLRSMMRKSVAYSAAKMKAKNYFGLGGEPTKAPLVMGTKQYAEENWPTLGLPKDTRIAVPVPPGMEDVAEVASKLKPLSLKERNAEIERRLLKQSGAR